MNGGICMEQFGPGFTCICTSGFTGQQCATEVINCQSDFCLNSGTCVEGQGNISCNCSEGFGGERCQDDLPFCRSNSCLNGGTCVEGLGPSTTCNCSDGFGGERCHDGLKVDACLGDPCQNGGTCTNTSSSDYVCDCGNEFTGFNCESQINHCALAGASCTNGRCVDGIGTFICQCNPGFTGVFCSVAGSESTDSPNSLPVNLVTFWVTIGISASTVIVLNFILFILCCVFIRKRIQKVGYVSEKAKRSVTLENAAAEQSQEMRARTITMEVNRQSFSDIMDSSAMLF